MSAAGVRGSFAEQAAACARLGSPFTTRLLGLLGERLDLSHPIGVRILSWPGDPGGLGDALALRAAGGLHALARSGRRPDLAALYPPAPLPEPDRLWAEAERALRQEAAFLGPYLDSPPQTNEVGRSAVLMAGFLVIAQKFGLPLALREIGASAGLNLVPDRYAYRFGAAQWGKANAKVLLAPDWQGPPPPVGAGLSVAERKGADANPIDLEDVAAREKLVSYVWPDQTERMMRLEAAIATFRAAPISIARADAAEWVETDVGTAHEGCAEVLYHSIVWRYLSAETQERIVRRLEKLGATARATRPLCWLRMEHDDNAAHSSLRLTLWPGGETQDLARCHPHGTRIRWLEPA